MPHPFLSYPLLTSRSGSFPTPWLTPVTVTSSYVSGLMSYKVPAPAPQLASAVTIDSGDTRVLKAIYRSGFLYTARNAGYKDQATTVTYDVINTSTMKIASEARAMNVNAFYPAFDVPATTPLGAQFATANLITGTTTDSNGSLVYAGLSNNLKAGESSFFVQSSCSPACRWGDYFGGAVDPISGGLWVSGQYAKPPSIVTGIGQWGTWAGYYPWLTTQAFTDVPPSSLFFDFINVLSSWQITLGCSSTPSQFCPTDLVTRDQLATFIIKSHAGQQLHLHAYAVFHGCARFVPVFSVYPEVGRSRAYAWMHAYHLLSDQPGPAHGRLRTHCPGQTRIVVRG